MVKVKSNRSKSQRHCKAIPGGSAFSARCRALSPHCASNARTAFFLFRGFRPLVCWAAHGQGQGILEYATSSFFLRALSAVCVLCAVGSVPARSPAGNRRRLITLSNDAISATWSVRGGSLRWQSLTNHFTGPAYPSTAVCSRWCPKKERCCAPRTSRLWPRLSMRNVPALADSPKAPPRARSLRAGNCASYWKILRQTPCHLESNPARRRQLCSPGDHGPRAAHDRSRSRRSTSSTDRTRGCRLRPRKGSPVTAGTWFLGFEHPLSECRVRADRATCWLSRELPLQAGRA